MHFDRLEISCFRNLATVSLDLSPGLNFLYGPNGAGKTAILEAAHLLVRGRSFRPQGAGALIQQGQQFLAVRGKISDELEVAKTLAITRDQRGQTELKINGLPERRLSQGAQLVPLQVMLPDLSDLVFGGPAIRRQWLDWGMFHVEPAFLSELKGYQRLLKQRNAELKEISRGDGESNSLAPWTEQLVESAERVDEKRKWYIKSLLPVFEEILSRLAPELMVTACYRRGWPEDERLRKVLGDLHPREVKSGYTQMGPHRADIKLAVGGEMANAILSRGQGKVVASALKLSQAGLLSATANRTSVFLIDDIGAELDESHSAQFFEILQEMNCQILATSTLPAPVGVGDRYAGFRMKEFHVERGTVQQRD